jgi:hypothetical protein
MIQEETNLVFCWKTVGNILFLEALKSLLSHRKKYPEGYRIRESHNEFPHFSKRKDIIKGQNDNCYLLCFGFEENTSEANIF